VTRSDTDRLEPLARVADIPPGGLAVTYRDGPFDEPAILLLEQGSVRAWRNRCRHLQLPLDGRAPGTFLSPDGRHLVCSEHGAIYRRDDGTCEAGPCRGATLRPLPIRVADGVVYLDRAGLASLFPG